MTHIAVIAMARVNQHNHPRLFNSVIDWHESKASIINEVRFILITSSII